LTDSKLPAVAYRYVAGRPLFERAGSYPYLSRGDGWWSGWQRQMARLTMPGFAAMGVAYPAEARTVALTAAVGGVTWARRRWRRRRFRRAYVSPTVKAIRVPLGTADVSLDVDPRLGRLVARLAKPLSPAEEWTRDRYGRWVEPVWKWPVDQGARVGWVAWDRVGPGVSRVVAWFRRPREQHGPRIRLTAAVPFVTSEQRSMISAIVKAKVPAGDMIESWDQVGAEVTATWTPRKRPPSKVGLAELEAIFAKLAEWEFYLGQGPGNVPVTISLHDDSPHIALSAGSGAGKSVFAQLVAVQVLRRGGRVVILDRKGSHRWALSLPGVDYCTTAAQMHEALLKAAAVADERNQLAMHEPEGWDPGPRVLVICEELNATIGLLAGWWADTRDKSDPKRSPAIAALADIAFMGRSAKHNLLAIAQMLTARAIGGPEARENFGVRCLARYTTNAAKMLVPEASMPRASRALGRWQVVVGGQATETQVCYLTHAQARAFSRVTGRADCPDGALSSGVTGNESKPVTEDQLMTLAEAIRAGILPWSKAATKMRLRRAREAGRPVPDPRERRGLQTDLYAPDDLASWVESEMSSS
jgi:hypothetical protein